MKNNIEIIKNLNKANVLELTNLLNTYNDEDFDFACKLANELNYYGNRVFMRALIEFSNYCKNNCKYCGLQAKNNNICRYRMDKEEISDVIRNAILKGFKSIVLQSGEDNLFRDDDLIYIIENIKKEYGDIAITLSIGEKTYRQYELYKKIGVDRYLLRHETIDKMHYEILHPQNMSYENRIECLYNLKKLGYQVGTGFMVGSPMQKIEMIAKDLLFIRDFNPEMVGIGPFIKDKHIEYKDYKSGDIKFTLFLISIIRIMLPFALIPSTTALSLKSTDGFISGIKHGANVIMLNMTPKKYREKYLIYDDKENVQDEECTMGILEKNLLNINKVMEFSRGDYKDA